jgi:hypothetical protein
VTKNNSSGEISLYFRTWETRRTTFDFPTAHVIVNAAVLPVANFNFERSVEVVREVLMSPVELLLIDFTSVTLLAPDLPVMEHVALRALETV